MSILYICGVVHQRIKTHLDLPHVVLPVPGRHVAGVVRNGRKGCRVLCAVGALLPPFPGAEGGEGPAEVAVEVFDELILRPVCILFYGGGGLDD